MPLIRRLILLQLLYEYCISLTSQKRNTQEEKAAAEVMRV